MALPGLNKEQSDRLRALQLEYNRRMSKIIEIMENNINIEHEMKNNNEHRDK